MNSNKLNIGAWKDTKKGWINLDKFKYENIDVVQDLDKFPYKLPDNHFIEVEMIHVLEHLENPVRVMEEIHRICKNKARVVIAVPHWSHFMSWGDLTHKRVYSSAAFLYYEKGFDWTYYSKFAHFKVRKKYFTATRINLLWLNKILNPILNLNVVFTELILCKVLPVSQVVFELEVIK